MDYYMRCKSFGALEQLYQLNTFNDFKVFYDISLKFNKFFI